MSSEPPITPTLQTARLTLRRHVALDLDAAAALWAEDAVIRFIGGRRFTREEVWHRLLRYVGHWDLQRYGYWAIVERDGGRYVGDIGFADWKRPRLAPYAGVPECGWVLAPDVHRRGYASEALAAVLHWGDVNLRCATICLISDGNVASNRLAARHGYRASERTPTGETIFRREPRSVDDADRSAEVSPGAVLIAPATQQAEQRDAAAQQRE